VEIDMEIVKHHKIKDFRTICKDDEKENDEV
jgi:hypothetical protein